jgi:hypothetical protein
MVFFDHILFFCFFAPWSFVWARGLQQLRACHAETGDHCLRGRAKAAGRSGGSAQVLCDLYTPVCEQKVPPLHRTPSLCVAPRTLAMDEFIPRKNMRIVLHDLDWTFLRAHPLRKVCAADEKTL